MVIGRNSKHNFLNEIHDGKCIPMGKSRLKLGTHYWNMQVPHLVMNGVLSHNCNCGGKTINLQVKDPLPNIKEVRYITRLDGFV